MSTNTETRQDILTAARAFAAGMAETSVYKEYEEAAQAFRKDHTAQSLLRRFQSAQQNAQRFAAWGGGTPNAGEEDPQKLQAEVTANPVLSRYFSSQENLVGILKETDKYMTKILSFDFADLTRPAGGCC